MSQTALAAHPFLNEYWCPNDINNGVGSCTANEISIASISNVVIEGGLTECVEGQEITIVSYDFDLAANTGTRYDVTGWIGRLGNDPRLSATDNACSVSSLDPALDDSYAPEDYIKDVDGDECADMRSNDSADGNFPSPFLLTDDEDPVTVLCLDANGNGIADIEVVLTWWQNDSFVCGAGDQTPPYDPNDPIFSPGAKSKCDYSIQDLGLTFTLNPDMSIEKTVTDVGGDGPGGMVDAAGDVIAYQVVATNTGETALNNVQVGDPLFEGFNQATDCTPNLPATLGIGESVTCTGTYEATQDDLDDNGDGDGDIDNQAFASADETGVINDSASVPLDTNFAMTIEKTVTDVGGGGPGGSVDAAGDLISYQVVVTNTGNTTLTGVDVSDPLFDGFDSSSDCSPAAPASLAPAATMTCTGEHAATQAEIDSDGGGDGDIDNTATATANELPSEQDSASAPIVQAPAMTLAKTSGTSVISVPGQLVSYTFVITNTGNTTLTGVSLSDPNLDAAASCTPAAPASLAPGAVMNCSGTHIVTADELNGLTSLKNTATADSNETPPVTDDHSIPIVPREFIPVPVDNKWALLMLTLMVLGAAWYFRSARRQH